MTQEENTNIDTPVEPITPADILAWLEAVAQLTEVKSVEMNCRKRIAANLFPTVQKSTQSWNFGDSAGPEYGEKRLTCVYGQNYKVDTAALTLVGSRLMELGVDPNTLVKWEPKLNEKVYLALSDEQRAVADEAVSFTWGSPTIKLADAKKR